MIGLNCATGPAEMSEHLRYLARHSRIPLLLHAERGPAGARQGRRALPARRPRSWPTPRRPSSASTACPWSAAAAAPRPSTCARSSSGSAASTPAAREPRPSRAPPRSTRRSRSARTPRTWRSASAPTPTARRSSARPCWRAAGTTAWRWPATRSARARTCSTCASTTSAATASPTWRSWPAASPPPPPCRSCWTPPRSTSSGPGLEKLGGRAVINSVNYEDGDGPESRFAQGHRAGPASTAPR